MKEHQSGIGVGCEYSNPVIHVQLRMVSPGPFRTPSFLKFLNLKARLYIHTLLLTSCNSSGCSLHFHNYTGMAQNENIPRQEDRMASDIVEDGLVSASAPETGSIESVLTFREHQDRA